MKTQIRTLLVDDQEIMRLGLRQMLGREEDIKIVADCASAEEAFSQIEKLLPDVVLMDIWMPGIDGIEATRCLKKDGKKDGRHCRADVIVLAEDADHMIEALEAGAAGYVVKDVGHGELARTIKQAYWSTQEKQQGLIIEELDLVLSPQAKAAQVMRFTSQVEQTLHTGILKTVGSWERGSVVTIRLESTPLADVLALLRNIPNVAEAEVKSPERDRLPSFFPRKWNFLPRLKNNSQSVLVTLKN
ncbi:MAG TPA: response regulator transcription factor [Dehalococcoidia bacterium]|nr:response regulator transcription factor [Dehalococcoidia bacterium]